jgi:hypothetical protein
MKKLLATVFVLFVCSSTNAQNISLKGKWRFKIDKEDKGITERWFTSVLNDSIQLPGSMLQNDKGDKVTLQTKWTGSIYDSSWYFNPRYAKYRTAENLKFPFWLTPVKYYVGAAWYQKNILVSAAFRNKRVQLFLERCHTETIVWIDDKQIGLQNSMVAPHVYDITDFLSEGKNTITIRIDNRIKAINVGPDSHSLTDHTQGNWNGIVGKIELQVTSKICINKPQIYTNIESKKITVKVPVIGDVSGVKKIILSAKSFNTKIIHTVASKEFITFNTAKKDTLTVEYVLGKETQLWSEFEPALYKLNIQIMNSDGTTDKQEAIFGMRSFKALGKQFAINGQTTFLRGTVENCVFPLTGYAPMDEASWERVFRICKLYGLNHMRFHSFCPPEAAFAAADKIGFYLQPEGPSWANHGSSLGDKKPIDTFIYAETNRMEQYYGNHPSYCMLAYGNEPRGGRQVEYLTNFIKYWQAKDSRRLYTGASVAMSWPLVPANEFMIKSGARNLAWNKMPESISDYTSAIEKFSMPYVAHELGQWCVFPDFKEIKKYTGVYKAKNFELFQEDVKDAGMLDEAERFTQASGKLQLLCYKNEIEKSLRTPLNGGFQLLSLNDYSGQGTALVGLLNAFWDERGYCTAQEFSKFCNSTVPLIRTGKFQYLANEKISADIEIYHYGKSAFNNAIVYWKLKDNTGKIIQSGSFKTQNIATGKNTVVGNITCNLTGITNAAQLNLEVGIEKSIYKNDWNFWVYPVAVETKTQDIYYTTNLDSTAEAALQKGVKVFLNIAGKVVKGNEVAQTFLPVFWNTSWFKMRPPHTLGISLNETHPAFKGFPTKSYSDLQWWEIVNKTQVIHLEDFPKNFKPLVRPIDTWFMNRRLALIFEAKVGNGAIIVSSADLNDKDAGRPAAKQLYKSLIDYMSSKDFAPKQNIDIQLIKDILSKPSKFTFDAFTKDSPDELKPKTTITN